MKVKRQVQIKLPKKVLEGSAGFEESREGDRYLDEVYQECIDRGFDPENVNGIDIFDEYRTIIYHCFIDGDEASMCVDKLEDQLGNLEETVQNVVMENFRAKTVNEDIYEKPYVSDHTGSEPEPKEDNWPAAEEWTKQVGEKAEFDLRGMGSDWEMDDPEGFSIAKKHDRDVGTVTNQATFTEVGDPDYEYYDIEFDDGDILYAVSGYHLFDV